MVEADKKKCFVMMPISDTEGYEKGHFNRVYEHLIKPAVLEAGFEPIRADEINATNVIALNIMEHICTAPISICDISNCNPNVFYELGIRHSTLLPVVLIKDSETSDPFDIKGVRYIEYDKKMSVDNILTKQNELTSSISSTMDEYNSGSCKNSLLHLIKDTQFKDSDLIRTAGSNTAFIKKEVERISNMIDNSGFIEPSGGHFATMLFNLRMLCNEAEDRQLYEYIKAKYKCKYPHSYALLI